MTGPMLRSSLSYRGIRSARLSPIRTRRWACRADLGPTPSCQRRFCSTPAAKKCGATSAIWTGRAARQLNCCPKPAALYKKAEQPAINGHQAQGNKRKAEEVLRRQLLAKEEAAEQDRDWRDKQRHEQGI